MNDGSDDDDESEYGNGKKAFASDDEDELFENDGIKEASMHQEELNSSVFDSLKEDTPEKKPAPVKRKLGAKPEIVKVPTSKRPKKNSDSDDSPIKVSKRK